MPILEGVSSSRIRELVAEGDVEGAAKLLGRPVEVEGTVVTGDARGGTLGFPTANLDVRPELLVPANGIYAGAAGEHRAAVSIGTNPHYGGRERRVEAHLLDFDGDLYGRRLVVELWQRLPRRGVRSTREDEPDRADRAEGRRRPTRAEPESARAPRRTSAGCSPRASHDSSLAVSPRIARGAVRRDRADAAEVVVAVGPRANLEAG